MLNLDYASLLKLSFPMKLQRISIGSSESMLRRRDSNLLNIFKSRENVVQWTLLNQKALTHTPVWQSILVIF